MDIKGTNYSIAFKANDLTLNYKKSKKDYFDSCIFLIGFILSSVLGVFALKLFINKFSLFVLFVSIIFLFLGIIQLLKLLDRLTHPKNSIIKIEKSIDLITIKRPFFIKKKLKISKIKSLEAHLIKSNLNFDSTIKKRHHVEFKLKLANNKSQDIFVLNTKNILDKPVQKPIEIQLKQSSNAIGNAITKELNVIFFFIK